MTAPLIFLACFIVVFALGLQSLNVNGGHKWLAALTSLCIGAANLYILKAVPQATGWLDQAAYIAAGPIAIVCSISAHPWLVRRMRGKEPVLWKRRSPTNDTFDAGYLAATERHLSDLRKIIERTWQDKQP